MIYLLRHGQTDWNKAGRMQGQTDIPLNQIGIESAYRAVESVLQKKITSIYSSDLLRAKQTAEIINSYLNVPLNFDKRLREIGYGDIEGKLKEEITPEMWDLFSEAPEKINAESFEKIYDRVKSFFSELDYKDNIMVVTHAGFIRMALYFNHHKQSFNLDEYKDYQYLKIENTAPIPLDF